MLLMKLNRTNKQIVGELGESIAVKFLEKKGFVTVERNYRRKFGEIDIVTKKKGVIHFVEVKTVSCENLNEVGGGVSDSFRPEDNVHPQKLRRLSRAIRVYLSDSGMGEESGWQFDVVTVLLDEKSKIAKVKLIEDVIL